MTAVNPWLFQDPNFGAALKEQSPTRQVFQKDTDSDLALREQVVIADATAGVVTHVLPTLAAADGRAYQKTMSDRLGVA